jgi:hypothetical protein
MKMQFNESSLIDFSFFFIWFCILLWFSPDISFYLNSPDHGVQISTGKMVLFGYIPFIDFLFDGGPLIPYTSAFGELVSNSLIGETIICSIGYAICLYLIYFLVSRQSSKPVGCFASIIGFLLLARFYKWYYWLFPLLALFCIYQLLKSKDDNPTNPRWLYISGFLCGIGVLYRPDLGAALFIFFMALIIFLSYQTENFFTNPFFKIISFSLFFIIPFLIWSVFLQLNGGSVIDYILMTYDGAIGNIQYWSIPVPSLDFENLFSLQSSIAIAYRLVLISLICGIGYSYFRIKNSNDNKLKYIFLMFSSILGLIIFPQAINRAGYAHLLQIVPPAIIVVCILLPDLWDYIISFRSPLKKNVCGLIIILYIGIILLSGWGISQSGRLGGYDLVKFNVNPIPKFVQIYNGTKSMDANPIADLISTVQNNTTSADPILIIPPMHQLYFFIDRPMSGMTLWYGPGIFDQEKWRKKNLERILDNPPKIIIIKKDFSDGFTNYHFSEYQPELYNYIISNYDTIVDQKQDLVILKRTVEQ